MLPRFLKAAKHIHQPVYLIRHDMIARREGRHGGVTLSAPRSDSITHSSFAP